MWRRWGGYGNAPGWHRKRRLKGATLRLATHPWLSPCRPACQGLSEEIEPSQGPITPAVLEEATLALFDALNLTRPHVAGWSLGAAAALKLAAHHPERVSKVRAAAAATALCSVPAHCLLLLTRRC